MRFVTAPRAGIVIAAVIAALGSTSCSGGGGSGGSVTAPPRASPSASPTSTPTPAPAAVTFSVVGIGSMYSTVSLDTNGSGVPGDAGDAASATTTKGEFGRDAAVIPNRISGTIPATASVALQAWGRDSVTGLPLTMMNAPAGATVISPYSALVFAHGSESTVRSALGLDAGGDAIRVTLNPLTFNPAQNLESSDPAVVRDAARLTSINVQLIAMAILLKDTNGDWVDRGAPLDLSSHYLAELIREGVGARLTDRGVILAALRKSAYRSLGDANLGLMADYLSAYFRTIPALLHTPAEARAWMHAFQFGVLADIRAPNFLSPSRVIPDETAIQAMAAAYMDAPSPVGTAFFTTTDYRELTNDPAKAMDFHSVLTSCSNDTALPTCNDSEEYFGMEIVAGQPVARVTAATPQDSTRLSVTLNPDGSITMSRVGDFLGLTWFTYTAQMPNSATANGRVYVRMRAFIAGTQPNN